VAVVAKVPARVAVVAAAGLGARKAVVAVVVVVVAVNAPDGAARPRAG
jgi:hypothetical protein